MNKVKEDLIHYIWRTKSFDQNNLRTIDNQEVHIISTGQHNDNAGPDFLNARIEIGETTWAGHVEIHLKASDWLRHRHDDDPQYQNVILHVVLEADALIALKDGTQIPCLALTPFIDQKLIARYQYLQNNKTWIPCEALISPTSEITKISAKDRALAQRLTDKAQELASQLKTLNGDLSALIYHRLAWSFGLKVNAEAMINLARSVPYNVIQKHRDQLLQVEAILFGQSGLLPTDAQDSYVEDLKREYNILSTKFGLRPIPAVMWKFSKLRPAGFPTIRIAQFARLLYQIPKLDNLVFETDQEAINPALNIELSGYWEHHYRFGSSSSKRKKSLGKSTQQVIIINAIVPVLFMYGVIRNSDVYKKKAINILSRLPAEHNSIMNRWTSLGMTNTSAADSQALLQLKKFNCDRHLCMSCPIGHKILTTDI